MYFINQAVWYLGNLNKRPGHITSFALVCCLLLSASFAKADTFSEPGNIVNELHYHLIEAMRNTESLGYEGRYDKLEPVISSRFDTPLIAKVILSRYWDMLDAEKRSKFIALFNKLSVATYASRFDSYSGEQFVEISREKLKRGRLLVKTELQRVDKKPVKLDYLMHEKDGKWYIISVIANGVNDLSLKRAEYAAVIKDKGYEALIEDVSAKIRDMENEANS